MSLWPLKIIIKILLSWVPGRHVILRKFGIFRHGEMDSVAYAHKIFKLHARRGFPDGLPKTFNALELGPGDSLLSALIAKAYGAQKIILVDAGPYASQDMELYHAAAKELRESFDLDVPDISAAKNIHEMLEICDAQYLTNGLEGLRSIDNNAMDFIWSHAVLEHIRKADFEPTMRELARIIKPEGAISHNVDLQDHLNYSLNNLRFPEALWEHNIIANAGFYTNRLRYFQSLDIMKRSGTELTFTEAGQWDDVPLKREKLEQQFRSLSDEELRIRTYSVVLKKAA